MRFKVAKSAPTEAKGTLIVSSGAQSESGEMIVQTDTLEDAQMSEHSIIRSESDGADQALFTDGVSSATPEPSPVLMSTDALAPLGPIVLIPGDRAAHGLLVDEDSDPDVMLTIVVDNGEVSLKFSASKPSHVILHLSLPEISVAAPALAALIEAAADRRIVLTPAFTIMMRSRRHRIPMRSAVIDAKPWTLTEAAALIDFDQSNVRVALTLDLVVEDVTLTLRRLRVW